MTKQLRARRDQATAADANDQARVLWWPDHANQPKRCLDCGAEWPADRKDSDPLPCGH